jgi:uncharacterized delta-60 repeat protein
VVDLTPNPVAGSLFAGFEGDPDCADGQVTLDASRTCIASFDIPGGWDARYDGPGSGEDEAYGLALGPAGEVVVVGGSEGDFAIVKYDADGGELWARRYDGPDADLDEAVAVVVDPDGNVYVTGPSMGSGAGYDYDYATIKYDASGDHQWTRRYDGPGHDSDRPKALAVDDDGNVYVTGWSTGSGTGFDYATVKYDADGTQNWVGRYDSPGELSGSDGAEAITVDAAGNVYVAGGSHSGEWDDDMSGDWSDCLTIKYYVGGGAWFARHDNEYEEEAARAIAVDDQGNVYVSGHSWWRSLTIKYASDGTPLWSKIGAGDEARAIALDRWGNVHVAGSYTIKYDPDGNELWSENNGGTAEAVAVDPAGNVFVAGWIRSGSYDVYLTIGYDPDGNRIFEATYDGVGTGHDHAHALVIDPAGDVIVTGGAREAGSRDFVTLKYAGIAAPVLEDSDGDGIPDDDDNCPDVANVDQVNSNEGEDDDPVLEGLQAYGNVCDPDLDSDGDIDGMDRLMQLACFRGQTFPDFDCAHADLVGSSLSDDPDPGNLLVDGLDRLQMLRWFRSPGSVPGELP